MSRKGPVGFESHYSSVYGERWPALRAALLEPVKQVARVNAFASHTSGHKVDFHGCMIRPIALGDRIVPQTDTQGLLDCYFMDAASVFPALALDVQSGDEVLDLCAAPGGKSLILAERIGAGGRLVANEPSDRRRARLRAVIEDYLPREVRDTVRVTGHDGARWCLHETEAFDRILVDAPCSGERHILASTEELAEWSPARSKNLAVRQYALLASALAVVRVGGRIVYSTCSLSPLENDSVIARLLKKREGEARVIKVTPSLGDTTEHGVMILPDQTGYGPIYYAVLERLS